MPPRYPGPPAAVPYYRPVPARPAGGRPGFVVSPYDPMRVIDVRGIPRGSVIPDPYTGRPIIVP